MRGVGVPLRGSNASAGFRCLACRALRNRGVDRVALVDATNPAQPKQLAPRAYLQEIAYDEANRPPADWGSFKRLALTHPGLNAAMAAALPLAPAAALALPAALMRAEQGATADFAGCWRAVWPTARRRR